MILGIDPKNDYAFKRVFGSEKHTDLLVDLLNAVLNLPPGQQVANTPLSVAEFYQNARSNQQRDRNVAVFFE